MNRIYVIIIGLIMVGGGVGMLFAYNWKLASILCTIGWGILILIENDNTKNNV